MAEYITIFHGSEKIIAHIKVKMGNALFLTFGYFRNFEEVERDTGVLKHLKNTQG